jgi:hypothetical protein
MANTLTGLIPVLYEAIDVVSRELTGLIPAVTWDREAARAAFNQDVTIPITPAAAAGDITPGVTPPNDGDQTIGNTVVRITKSRRVPVRWNGEEQRGVNSGPGYQNILRDQFAQAMRTLVNEIEVDVGAAAKIAASRAHGTAGTAPFGATPGIGDLADTLKILEDNGCPRGDLQAVVNTAAATNLRKLGNLYKLNESGENRLLRQGVLGDLYGFALRASAGVAAHTKGTGSGATTNNAGYAVGATVIALASAGAGTIVAGDVITFAGDSNKYVVVSGDADVSGGGTITLAAPGLRQAIPASATNITVGNNYAANVAFHRSSLLLVTRAPALPEEGDLAVDRMIVTDPVTGLSFEISKYLQYRQVQYEIAAAWGVKGIKPEHAAILLG